MLKGILTLVAVCGLLIAGPLGCSCCGKCQDDGGAAKKAPAKAN